MNLKFKFLCSYLSMKVGWWSKIQGILLGLWRSNWIHQVGPLRPSLWERSRPIISQFIDKLCLICEGISILLFIDFFCLSFALLTIWLCKFLTFSIFPTFECHQCDKERFPKSTFFPDIIWTERFFLTSTKENSSLKFGKVKSCDKWTSWSKMTILSSLSFKMAGSFLGFDILYWCIISNRCKFQMSNNVLEYPIMSLNVQLCP